MMHTVKIVRRTVVDGHVWQGSVEYNVDDDTLERLIDAGAVEIKAHAGAHENKAEPKRRGRPRKVQE